MRTCVVAAIAAACFFGGRPECLAVPLVYSGYGQSFTKASNADQTLPENQDRITSEVRITRANLRGIYNAALETSYENFLSPVGTTWAFPHNNPGKTISAANWQSQALNFQDWETANGGAVSGGPPATVGQNAVVHLVANDIYLDIRFTAWGMGSGAGGNFSLVRAAVTPSADFNRDGGVDGDDLLLWQRGVGTIGALQSQGDANFDGVVDGADLTIWRGAYGSAVAAALSVPEPGGLALAAMGLLGVMRRRR